MSWKLAGEYFENCSCDAICPCTWSNLARPATYDECRATLAFRIREGTIEGLDVTGRVFVLAVEAPKMITEGNWRVGLVFDEETTDAQIDAISRVVTGQLGGPWEALAPLVGEVLGAERAAIDLDSGEDGWVVRVGGEAGSKIAGETTRAPDSGAVELTNIVAHPAGPTLTVTPAAEVRSSFFGIEWSGTDRSGFTAPFSWAA